MKNLDKFKILNSSTIFLLRHFQNQDNSDNGIIVENGDERIVVYLSNDGLDLYCSGLEGFPDQGKNLSLGEIVTVKIDGSEASLDSEMIGSES